MLGNHPYSRLALAMSRALLWTVVLVNFVLILTLEKERLVPYDYEPSTYHYVNSAEPNSPELFRLGSGAVRSMPVETRRLSSVAALKTHTDQKFIRGLTSVCTAAVACIVLLMMPNGQSTREPPRHDHRWTRLQLPHPAAVVAGV